MTSLKNVLVLAAALFLVACGKENLALNEFQQSAEAAEIGKCVGVTGNIDWSIFKTDKTDNLDVRIIMASITKGEYKFTAKWHDNIKTKISEFIYGGKADENTSRFSNASDLTSFCMGIVASGKKTKADSEVNLGTNQIPESTNTSGGVQSSPLDLVDSYSRRTLGKDEVDYDSLSRYVNARESLQNPANR